MVTKLNLNFLNQTDKLKIKKLSIILVLLFAVSATLVKAQTIDTAAPQIRELTVSSDSVNVQTDAQTVTFLAHVTDLDSGVSNVILWIRPGLADYYLILNLERISGDKFDGIYRGDIRIDIGAPSERWEIGLADAYDMARNKISISYDDIVRRGFPTGFQIISNVPPTPRVKSRDNRKRIRFVN